MKTSRSRLLLILPVIAWIMTACQGGEFARSIQLTNNARESSGVHVVLNNKTLQAKAQQWAGVLASRGSLVHSNLAEGAGGGWKVLGENLAKAGSIEEAHSLFMNSSSHRHTLMSSRYSQVGVGVVHRGGYYYVVQVFGG